jgi:lysophosphatidate acyltransferase
MTVGYTILTYVVLPCTAMTLSFFALAALLPAHLSRLPAFAARCLASIAALIICATYGVLASIVLRLVGYPGLSQWTTARCFKWTMWFFTGVWFEILEEGSEGLKTRPAVIVANHQT